ncbi:hypothetical protein BJV78DRAFT_546121 [Lactifluus subvellereus]|nr:hypothetical protein BJV78DRAFT_546121 [Lactifluus subvellereus]
MSNQFTHTHLYQHHHSSTDYSTGPDQYHQPQSQSQAHQQPPHAQPLAQPVSPVPLHYLAHTQRVDHFSSQVASNQRPITAPSPQYPQQLPAVPHVGYSSPPTSPVSNGLSRRPLPTPGAPPSQFTLHTYRPPLPTPGPTPVPTSPRPRTQPLHPPGSLPTSGITFPAQQSTSSLPSPSPTSPTSSRRPLPLPRSVPGGFSDAATRSASPAKDVSKTSSALSGMPPPLPGDPTHPSTKFVPYWKRSLPDPSSDRAASASSSQEAINACPSSSSSSVALAEGGLPQRDRSKSFTSGRPLPPSPLDGTVGKSPLVPPAVAALGERSRALPNPSPSSVGAGTIPPTPIKLAKSSSSLPTASGSSALFSTRPNSPTKSSLPSRPISPASSDDNGKPSENGKSHQKDHETPSPQYGIRDLPPKSRSVIVRNNAMHTRTPASIDRGQDEPIRGRCNSAATLPKPPLQSLSTQPSHRSTRSVTVRTAPAPPPTAGPSRLPESTPTSPSAWSYFSSPLPRVPRSGGGEQPIVRHTRKLRQEYVNLDDAPPPSLRRSPSPSGNSTQTVPQMKPRSVASNIQSGSMRDAPAPPRRSAVSVPSSPEKTPVKLPRVSSTSKRQGSRSRSAASANTRQPSTEPRPAQPPAVSRPPLSAFSQRFVSGKPAPAEPQVPHISTPGGDDGDFDDSGASIFVSEPELPQITFSDPTASSLDTDYNEMSPTDEIPHDREHLNNGPMPAAGGGRIFPPASSARRGGGLACGGCGGPIVGRIVSAMGVRWHPGCFRCSDCDDLLEYVSSYERDGKPYCHFDYHERFAPRCYHCKTPIVDERFITLDDPELGKRTYHEQHFFCSECGDPFLAPSIDRQNGQGAGGITFKGDGEFENDDVGFTVYKGYPYCEACHVRLRSPRCKKCKNIIRDGMQAVEALGGKYHWVCFCCTGCDKPFDDPSFFLRENKAFCERCYSIILKSEM